jgi:hypothetical protein
MFDNDNPTGGSSDILWWFEGEFAEEFKRHSWLSGNCSCGNDTHDTLADHLAWAASEVLRQRCHKERAVRIEVGPSRAERIQICAPDEVDWNVARMVSDWVPD